MQELEVLLYYVFVSCLCFETTFTFILLFRYDLVTVYLSNHRTKSESSSLHQCAWSVCSYPRIDMAWRTSVLFIQRFSCNVIYQGIHVLVMNILVLLVYAKFWHNFLFLDFYNLAWPALQVQIYWLLKTSFSLSHVNVWNRTFNCFFYNYARPLRLLVWLIILVLKLWHRLSALNAELATNFWNFIVLLYEIFVEHNRIAIFLFNDLFLLFDHLKLISDLLKVLQVLARIETYLKESLCLLPIENLFQYTSKAFALCH